MDRVTQRVSWLCVLKKSPAAIWFELDNIKTVSVAKILVDGYHAAL